MLREFFDITRDSREIFKGLAIGYKIRIPYKYETCHLFFF